MERDHFADKFENLNNQFKEMVIQSYFIFLILYSI
jgi:hypothetical protein